MFEKQRNTAKYTKARPYIFIMYYKNRIMLTGENKTQTSKKQASKCKLGRKNKQSNQNMIQPNFYHVESSFSPVQFSRSVMSDSVIPWIAARQASLSLCIHIHYAYIFREYDIFYKHRILYFYTIVSLHNKVSDFIIFQGIFPTQGSNPGLPHCRPILYQLSHKGSPRILEWVAYPFSRGSSQPRNQNRVSCIAGGFFTNWAIREAQQLYCWSCKISQKVPFTNWHGGEFQLCTFNI